MPEETSGKTELWSNDPRNGEAILLETFGHPLDEADLHALAVAIALPFVDHLTLDDLWSM